MSAEGLNACVEKMRREGIAEVAIDTFRHYYQQLESGETGLIREGEIEPLGEVPDFDELLAAARAL